MNDPKKKGRKTIDWLPVEAAFMADHNLNHEALAKRFGISLISVRKKSAAEKWHVRREEIISKSTLRLQDKIVDQRVKAVDDFNSDDIKLAKAIRAEVARELTRLKSTNKLDGDKLMKLASAHEKAQKVARLALGLNTNSNELTGKGGEPLNVAPPVINVSFGDEPQQLNN